MPDAPLSAATERFGENLKAARLELGLTQRDFAHEAQLDESTYRKIELGYRNPNLHNLIRIVDVFGLSWDELMAGIDASMVPAPRVNTTAQLPVSELRRRRDERRRGPATGD